MELTASEGCLSGFLEISSILQFVLKTIRRVCFKIFFEVHTIAVGEKWLTGEINEVNVILLVWFLTRGPPS